MAFESGQRRGALLRSKEPEETSSTKPLAIANGYGTACASKWVIEMLYSMSSTVTKKVTLIKFKRNRVSLIHTWLKPGELHTPKVWKPFKRFSLLPALQSPA